MELSEMLLLPHSLHAAMMIHPLYYTATKQAAPSWGDPAGRRVVVVVASYVNLRKQPSQLVYM
jgi:hypothetical protein